MMNLPELSEKLGPLPEPRLWYDPETQRCSSMVPLRPTYEPLWGADDLRAYGDRERAAERERAARVCDDEARIRTEAGNTHPEDSDSRGRCFAAARAAINCAKGVRGGEVVGPNVRAKRETPHDQA